MSSGPAQPQHSNTQLPEEIVSALLELAQPTNAEPGSTLSADVRSTPLIRRGLSNLHNTCFLNAVLQSLLACEPFVSLLHALAATLTPFMQQLQPDSKQASGLSRSTGALVSEPSPDLSRCIPLTHELLLFAAQFRPTQHAPRPNATHVTPAAPALDQSSTPASTSTAASDTTLIALNADTATSTQSSTPECTPLALPSAQQADSSQSDPTPSVAPLSPTSSAVAATSTVAPVAAVTPSSKPKPKKKPKSDKDDSFLDALITQTASAAEIAAEEEEKRRMRNKKKKEKEKEKASLAKLKQMEEAARPASPEPTIVAASAAPPSPHASTAAPSKAELKKARKAAAAAAAAAASASALTPEPPAPAAADDLEIDSTPSTPPIAIQPVQDTVSAPVLSKKQQRVHRVEDEEEWIIDTKKPAKTTAAKSQQPKQKAPAQQPTASKQKHTTTVSAPAAFSPPPALLLGPAPSSPPFLPSFPHLLCAFQKSGHQHGRQEDAAELLQILCENVQEEWTQWMKSWNRPEAVAIDSAPAASTASAGSDDWNEVGKGSRPIKLVSSLSFAHSPLSRLFSGRVRTQLSVQHRHTDTMSLQPFYSLHLDIDEPLSEQALSLEQNDSASGASKLHRPRKKKAAVMSVERALDRYMCPSEVTGYKKKGAQQPPPPPVDEDRYGYGYGYGNGQSAQGSTRAQHMHALDSHSLPQILVLHLKRFEHSSHAPPAHAHPHSKSSSSLSKDHRHVKFNSTLLLHQKYLSTASATANTASTKAAVAYELNSIVVHHGHSMAGGHYTAFVCERSALTSSASSADSKSPPAKPTSNQAAAKQPKPKAPAKQLKSSYEDSEESEEEEDESNGAASSTDPAAASAVSSSNELWYHCDDQRITPVPAHTVYQQQAYLLFYTLKPVS